MKTQMRGFHNRLRVLLSIDQVDLIRTGVLPPDGKGWADYRADPFRWFIRADDETALKLWLLIEDRAEARLQASIEPSPF